MEIGFPFCQSQNLDTQNMVVETEQIEFILCLAKALNHLSCVFTNRLKGKIFDIKWYLLNSGENGKLCTLSKTF